MKTAILHPWFLMKGGGERVVDVFAEIYPEADIYALFVDKSQLSNVLQNRRVTGSKLNSIPWSSKLHRELMPLYPWAVESFDLSCYDLVISSCGPSMMGAAVHQEAVHICYCHTPQRSWWDLYAEHQAQLPHILRELFVAGCTYNRIFEFCAIQRVDDLIANSLFIQHRIQKYFAKQSVVIYPPVDTSRGYIDSDRGDYYLYLGRLERQKRVDLLIQACNRLGRKLIVVGKGAEAGYLKSLAGPTVTLLGYVPDGEIGPLFARCRAFLFAAVEDFGIAPVEAQSYGRPVIAYGYGGSLETVRADSPDDGCNTGVYFRSQTVEGVITAIEEFEAAETSFSPQEIQLHARRFDTSVFMENFKRHVDEVIRRR